jgi:hypothetical protein
MNEQLDDLLSEPLASVADDGFSARVMGGVRAMTRRRILANVAVVTVCAVLALLILPWRMIGFELGFIVPQIFGSAAVSLAVGAVILTLSLEGYFSRQ